MCTTCSAISHSHPPSSSRPGRRRLGGTPHSSSGIEFCHASAWRKGAGSPTWDLAAQVQPPSAHEGAPPSSGNARTSSLARAQRTPNQPVPAFLPAFFFLIAPSNVLRAGWAAPLLGAGTIISSALGAKEEVDGARSSLEGAWLVSECVWCYGEWCKTWHRSAMMFRARAGRVNTARAKEAARAPTKGRAACRLRPPCCQAAQLLNGGPGGQTIMPH